MFGCSDVLANGADDTKTDLQQWTSVGFNHPFSRKWAFSIWSQARFSESASQFNQFLLNPGMHYRTSPSTRIGFGYQYHHRDQAADEHEPWQEFVFARSHSQTVVGHRLRLEQRFVDDVDGVLLRLRYRLLASRQLGSSSRYLVGSAAIWLNLNEQDTAIQQGFDQSRLFGGIGFHPSLKTRIELGYEWRYQDLSDKSNLSDHIIAVNIFFDTRGKPEKVPIPDQTHH